MKHNKLLEVAENKTKKQCDSIRTFLQRNKKLVEKQKANAFELKNSRSYPASNQSEAKQSIDNKQYGEYRDQYDPYSNVIKEEKERGTLDVDMDMENETNVDEMEALDEDSQILANLNIL